MKNEMIEEEETLLMIVKKFIIHKGGQEIPGLKVKLLTNMNVLLFLYFLFHVVQMLGIAG